MSARRGLPPLQSLLVFEAAARKLNFSEAARELGASQPAISQQVRALEADLGVALFRRLHRGVALTSAGGALLEAVAGGLDRIEQAAIALRHRPTQKILQVVTDFGFAAWWLMPRLGLLSELMPDVDVRIVTSQAEVDTRRDIADIAVLFGAGPWPGCSAHLLFAETAFPVCSPAFRSRHKPGSSAAAIARLRLLHLDNPPPARWLAWRDWFAAQGVAMGPRAHDLTFNNYQLVLQATLLGQGAALGWVPLTDTLLRDGHLVRLHPDPLGSARGYHLVQPQARPAGPLVARFREWVLAECAVPAS